MIVGYNEALLLDDCLHSIQFCDEILYADLKSTDNSINIVKKYTDQIYVRDKVPSCEYVQAELINYTRYEWVIFIDPDERIDKFLQQQIFDEFQLITENPYLGAVLVPWHFYFKKHKLKGTIWGGNNQKYLLANKNRFDFLPITHYGRKLKEGFIDREILLNEDGTNILHHHWMNSYSVFIKKHQRYLKNEARDQFNAGKRMGIKKAFFMPWNAFKESFFHKKGYKDGLVGLFLSIFWAYYQTIISIGLLRIQNHK